MTPLSTKQPRGTDGRVVVRYNLEGLVERFGPGIVENWINTGRYVEIPAEYQPPGDDFDYMQITPFTGKEPWAWLPKSDGGEDLPPVSPKYSPEFKEAFGDWFQIPQRRPDLDQNVEIFEAGFPANINLPGFLPRGTLEKHMEIFTEYNLGTPYFMKLNDDWHVRFPYAENAVALGGGPFKRLPNVTAWNPGMFLARWQIKQKDAGLQPANLHPLFQLEAE